MYARLKHGRLAKPTTVLYTSPIHDASLGLSVVIFIELPNGVPVLRAEIIPIEPDAVCTAGGTSDDASTFLLRPALLQRRNLL